jgi:BirA family biotin operon repressor/biotin-[acetyl-CoA-carboxylase] ligase
MSTRKRLIELLASGEFRSGEWLGIQLSISRAAVWKHIRLLTDAGMDVHAVRGRGYRLAQPMQPLDEGQIRQSMTMEAASRIQRLDILQVTDSTSDYLKRLDQADNSYGLAQVCIAELQSAGRGRRGRHWVSPYGSNLYLSFATQVNGARLASGGLSLAVAVAVVRALQHCGVPDLGLKWPNDIYYQGRKLAGILLDLSGESGGPYQVIVGVGVNLHMPESAGEEIDQPWADLSQTGVKIDRNVLAGTLLENLFNALDLFNEHGLESFTREWQRYDLVSGRAVELQHEHQPLISGVARGIDAHGALLVERDGVTQGYHVGEVSLRLAQ